MIRSPLSSAIRSALQPALGPPFELSQGVTRAQVIEALFGNGEQGAWYDPRDLSSMFQDSSGTTPVTGDGQPLGLENDQTTNGNTLSQGSASARPLVSNGFREFDGVDDFLDSGASFIYPVSTEAGWIFSVVVDTTGLAGRATVISGRGIDANSAFVLFACDSENGNSMRLFAANGTSVGTDIRDTGKRIITVTLAANAYSVYLDGVEDFTVVPIDTVESPLSTNASVGAIRYVGPIFAPVKLGEMVSAVTPVTTAKRELLEAYLAENYGVTL